MANFIAQAARIGPSDRKDQWKCKYQPPAAFPKFIPYNWKSYNAPFDDVYLIFVDRRLDRRSHIYTWLNNERVPIRVSATQYVSLFQRWILGKIHDNHAFPTDSPTGNTASAYASGGLNTPGANTPIAMGPTTSNAPLSTLAGHDWVGKKGGFPQAFFGDVKTSFRQIFRLYAHLYHSHWIDPFWHMSTGSNSSGWTDLNSCFVHFISVAKLFGLLSDKDMEPMQPLIDIWIANGSIPADAVNGACTIIPPQ
ncbi:MAG: hypothetical protein Q9214_003947 [Letrouitia sp. 1 TL-2023]